MRTTTPISLLALANVHHTLAWGDLGHQTVAYIASNFVAPSTTLWAQTILSDLSPSYLANIATWADSYRKTPSGYFSGVYHFIDALDTPPSSCNLNYTRDCGPSGCVISALQNYTARVADSSLDDVEIDHALRFIVHFLGDMHQPLHDEGTARGGNDLNVTFDGEKGNLHQVWDERIPEKLNGGKGLEVARAWAGSLSARITEGEWRDVSKAWTEGVDVADAVGSAMPWAVEANALMCTTVVPEGWNALGAVDLAEGYYDSAVPVVELQIARAGKRLAAWLDAVAATQTSMGYRNDL